MRDIDLLQSIYDDVRLDRNQILVNQKRRFLLDKYAMRKWLELFESTNSQCDFIEVEPGQWWYVLDQWRPGYDEDGEEEEDHRWDWREDAVAEGPFATMEAGRTHLGNNYANPGGSSAQPYHADYKPDSVMLKLMDEAKKRKTARGGYRF